MSHLVGRQRYTALVRDHHDLVRVVEQNPFPTAEQEPAKHLVQFLFEPPTEAERARSPLLPVPGRDRDQPARGGLR